MLFGRLINQSLFSSFSFATRRSSKEYLKGFCSNNSFSFLFGENSFYRPGVSAIQHVLFSTKSSERLPLSRKYERRLKRPTKGLLKLVSADDSSARSSSYKKVLKTRRGRGHGRNNTGRITAPRRGGGSRRNVLNIAPSYDKKINLLTALKYDSNNTGAVGVIEGKYMLLCKGMEVGKYYKKVEQKDEVALDGDEVKIGNMRPGSIVCNIGGKICVEAGAFGQVLPNNFIKLKSGEQRYFHPDTVAKVGMIGRGIGTKKLGDRSWVKAGRNRNLGIRPKVRRCAKNAVDRQYLKYGKC